MTVLGQTTITYSYDNADRLTQIIQDSTTVSIAYDAAGRRTSLTAPNGVVTEYSYDAASRLIGQTFKNGANVLGTLTYGYDASGSRVSTGGTWARTGLPSTVASATYNAANQQTAFAGTTQTVDLNGNLTSDGTNTYTWDARNQLASMSGGSLTASFAYDALGRRRSKTVNSIQTRFHYDSLTPVQELDGSGSIVANFLTGAGIDEYLARTDGASTRSHLTDILGSTLAELDASVATQAEYTYEPFGKTALSGISGNALRYTGREDDGTGLYYYRARYYHPIRQRFISEDPIGFRGGINPYAYVQNRPTRYIDPWGLRAGDLYKSLNAAGIAATCDAAGPTVQNGWEYGGWIYQVPEGWTYSEAQTTRMQSTIDPFLPPDPSRGTVGGWYHTHPVGVARPSAPDYEVSFRYNAPGYVWGRRPAFGGGGPHVVTKFSGRKDPVEDLGSCPSPPDVAPAL
jgi:RHS repeat-associated protein